MRHPRMVGLRGEDRLEDRRGLELAGIGLVVRVRSDVERERMENRGFLILGVALRELLHCLFVPQHALAPGRPVVRVKGCDRFDVVALALRLGRGRQTFVHRGLAFQQHILRRLPAKRIEQPVDAYAPVGDRARRVGGQHLEKSLAAFREPERMQQRHAALELRLHLRIAGSRKTQPAELFRRPAGGLLGIVVVRQHALSRQSRKERAENECLPSIHVSSYLIRWVSSHFLRMSALFRSLIGDVGIVAPAAISE